MLWYDHSNLTLSAILSPGTIFSRVVSLNLFFTPVILTFSMSAKVLCKLDRLSQAEGGGGVLRISSDKDDRMEAKIKPKISLRLPTKPKKSLDQNFTPDKSHAEFSVEYPPKFPPLNQASQKKFLPKFPYPKNSKIENFKPQKILRPSLQLDIRSTSPPGISVEGGGGGIFHVDG